MISKLCKIGLASFASLDSKKNTKTRLWCGVGDMSRLGARIRGSAQRSEAHDDEQTSLTKETARILPYDCCADFLSAHPLVIDARLDPRAVHAALLSFDAHVSGAKQEEEEVQEKKVLAAPRCVECARGHILLDEHNGVEVCDTCGLVQTRASINVTPEFVAPVPDSQLVPPHKRAHGVRGVATWMVKKLSSDPEKARRESYWEDLLHYNVFVHHSEDDLRVLARHVHAWVDAHGGVTREVRIAAALLHPRIRAQFMDESDVRKRLRTQQGLQTVVDPTPAPAFACTRCGARVATQKDARFHCRGPSVYRS